MSLTAAVRVHSPVLKNRRGVEATVATVYFWLQRCQPNIFHCSKQWGVLCSACLHQGVETELVSIQQQKTLGWLHYLQSHQTLLSQKGIWWIDTPWSEDPVMKTGHKFIVLYWNWRLTQGPGSLLHNYQVNINKFAASSALLPANQKCYLLEIHRRRRDMHCCYTLWHLLLSEPPHADLEFCSFVHCCRMTQPPTEKQRLLTS